MVSIIIPVIRPAAATRCIVAITENAGIPHDQYEIVTETDTERIGCPRMVRRLVARTSGDLVCFLGDDTIPQPYFLKNALAAMATLPDGWGLVGFNDQHHDGNVLATHWLADKRLLLYLDGEFFHTGYWHCYCDGELTLRCQQLGRYVWAKDAVIEHDHPLFKNEQLAGDYARVYSSKYVWHDKALFIQRNQQRGAIQ